MLLFIGFMGSSPTAKGQQNLHCPGIDITWSNDVLNGGTYTNQDIGVNGTLTITGIVTFNNCNFKMATDAVINIMGAGSKLILNNSTLFACHNDMWQGIRANIFTALTMNQSNIHDAEIAVYGKSNADLEIVGNIFDHNYKHIRLENYSQPAMVNIISNHFQSTLVPLAKHPGFGTKYLIFPHTDSPFTTQRVAIGIECDNVDNDILIGSNQLLNMNYFDNLEIGIYAINSQLIIRYNQFDNIYPDIVNDPNFEVKAAIKVEADDGSLDSRVEIGSLSHENYFNNCYNGIYISRPVDTEIILNKFTTIANKAITCRSINGKNIAITHNNIIDAKFGIFLNNTELSTALVQCNGIVGNNLCSGGAIVGIADIGMLENEQPPQHHIYHNYIDDYAQGIVCVSIDNLSISHNEIHVNYCESVARAGITVVSSILPYIYHNVVIGDGQSANFLASAGVKIVSNTGGFIKSNWLEGLGEGFSGQANNMQCEIFNNILHENVVGFGLGNAGIVGMQGSILNDIPCYNEWTSNSLSDCYAYNSINGSLSPIIWLSTIPPINAFNPNPSLFDGISSAITTPSISIPSILPIPWLPNDDACYIEIDGFAPNDTVNMAIWADILQNYAEQKQSYEVYVEEQIWWDNYNSYRMMRRYPELTTNNDIISAYYAKLQQEPIGKLTDWMYDLGNYLETSDKTNFVETLKAFETNLNAITTTNLQEGNLQQLYTIILSQLQQTTEGGYGTNTIATLETMANYCPFEGGPATYQTAALLHKPPVYFDDCNYSGKKQTALTQKPQLTINQWGAAIVFRATPQTPIEQIPISAIDGRILYQTSPNNSMVVKNSLNAGMYVYIANLADGTIAKGKFIVH